MNHHHTIYDVIVARKLSPNRGVTFVLGADREEFVSYAKLFSDAGLMLGALQNEGVKRGDELMFQIENNKLFITVFWACVLGGIKAVPLSVGHVNENVKKLDTVAQKLSNPWLITSEELWSRLSDKISPEFKERLADKMLVSERLKPAEGIFHEATPEDIAFIQFSSGSTGNPKGVQVTHAMLVCNATSIASETGLLETDEHLPWGSWMPLTHDMGLIGFHLTPLLLGVDQVNIPTSLFIRRPMLWLLKVAAHGVAVTSSPNFGYRHCLNQFIGKEGQYKDLNLEAVRVIYNGAEPISATLCNEFIDAFEPHNLKPEAMFTVYGLAEATLAVSIPKPGNRFTYKTVDRASLQMGETVEFSTDKTGLEVVNCGLPVIENSVRISDDEGTVLAEQTIGHIEVSGPHVTAGYYNDLELSEKALTNGWLDTGDLGFMLDGNLYITGRAKELIIVNGQNIYPQDLERVCEKIDGIDLGKVVACGAKDVENHTDQVLVFVLFKGKAEKFMPLAEEIRRLLLRETGHEISKVIPVRRIPKTTSGKVQRLRLVKDFEEGFFDAVLEELATLATPRSASSEFGAYIAGTLQSSASLSELTFTANQLKRIIQKAINIWLAEQLDTNEAAIIPQKSFADHGVSSMMAVKLANDLESFLGCSIDTAIAWQFPNIDALVEYLVAELQTSEAAAASNSVSADQVQEPIAIVGASCRFPGGVKNLDDFSKLLFGNVDAIGDVPSTRWATEKYFDGSGAKPGKMYCNQGGFIDQVDQFDAAFFGISSLEAEALDPQQRLLLELCWEACENAGLTKENLANSNTGLFVGCSTDDYQQINVDANDPTSISAYSNLGTARSVGAGRVAYYLDLRGPVLHLDTACSSSLVAIHQACQSLRLGECEAALAAGVNLMLTPEPTISLCQIGALSKDSRCKTFDASANGYVRGEGGGTVVLKRLSDAIADGDSILSVIKGSAINHDGASNGLTAPNGAAQEALLRKALQVSGLEAKDVQYVEAHGTGTLLGDPIELTALQKVYGSANERLNPLVVGSVKTNIGHLEAGAGMAGLFKLLIAQNQQEIPASLHFDTPNPNLNWDKLNIEVCAENRCWPAPSNALYAGISSFGLSGTNVHLILENRAEEKVEASVSDDALLLTLSALSPVALQEQIDKYIKLLNANAADVANICFSANTLRTQFPYRIAIAAKTSEKLVEKLKEANKRALTQQLEQSQSVTFLFTGQGAQYTGMCSQLYSEVPAFRAIMDECASEISKHTELPILDVIFDEAHAELLNRTDYTQPALFTIEYSMSKWLEHFGIKPTSLIGHSIGEYCAATLANVLTLEDAARLIVLRGKLMASLPQEGEMIAAFANAETIRNVIVGHEDQLSVAAENSQTNTVISGNSEAMTKVLEVLESEGVEYRKLNVSHAFHSPLMRPILEEFRAAATEIEFGKPSIEIFSTLTGNIVNDEMCSVEYWVNHIEASVRFKPALEQCIKENGGHFIEIGPKPVLTALGQVIAPDHSGLWLSALRYKRPEVRQFSQAIQHMFTAGIAVDWSPLYADKAYTRTALPNYPFQRKRFWIDQRTSAKSTAEAQSQKGHLLLNKNIATPVTAEIYMAATEAEIFETIGGHRLFAEVILPASLSIETALNETFKTTSQFPVVVSDLKLSSIVKPTSSTETKMQVVIEGEDEGQIYRLSGTHWESTASWKKGGEFEHELADLVWDENVTSFTADAYYAKLKSLGYHYTQGFNAIQAVKATPGKAEAQVALISDKDYLIHPATLDACFQTALGALLEDVPGGDSIYLPTGIDQIKFHAKPAGKTVTATFQLAENDTALSGNIIIRDELGNLIAEIAGLHFAAVPTALIVDGETTNLMHKMELVPNVQKADQISHTKWALIGGNSTLATTLGTSVPSVELEHLDMFDAEGIEQWMDSLVNGCQVVWATEKSQQCFIELLLQLELLQALEQRQIKTTFTHLVRGEDGSIHIAADSVQAMLRSVELESAYIQIRQITFNNSLQWIDELKQSVTEKFVAFKDGQRFVKRLQLVESKLVQTWTAPKTCLITGGAGALGQVLTSYLVERGAKHIVLLVRREPNAQQAEAIENATTKGAKITVFQTDITDIDTLTNDWLKLKKAGVEVNAVFHLAGVLDDRNFIAQSEESMNNTFEPKAKGAWNLHKLFMDTNLRDFVLFSSITSALGNAGQLNYAAANGFLDGLAKFRMQQNLQAKSINWGPVSGLGMTTVSLDEQGVALLGVTPINASQLPELFDQAFATNEAQIQLANIDWNKYNTVRPDSTIEDLVTTDTKNTQDDNATSALVHTLQNTEEANRTELLESYLQKELEQVLQFDDGEVFDRKKAFNEQGVTSLLGVELRNRLSRALAIELPAAVIFNYPNIETLSAHLLDQLDLASNVVEEVAVTRKTEEELDVEKLFEEMSDDDLIAMIEADLKNYE